MKDIKIGEHNKIIENIRVEREKFKSRYPTYFL